MFYVDSSVIVSAITAEAGTATALDWLGVQDFALSDWVVTETAAALAQKVRTGFIAEDEQRQAWQGFADGIAANVEMLPIRSGHFRSAADLAARSETGLRAGDALHLALAKEAGATLVTFDRGQARAGELLEVKVLLLPSAA